MEAEARLQWTGVSKNRHQMDGSQKLHKEAILEDKIDIW